MLHKVSEKNLPTCSLFHTLHFSCLAGGYPAPTYEWFKEEYENDVSTAIRIDPLSDRRYTLSGGSLIIYNPNQVSHQY